MEMSDSEIFKSKKLNYLYKTGQFENILEIFNREINQINFLGAGGDASAFLSDDGETVIKICAKKSTSGYFGNFRNCYYESNQKLKYNPFMGNNETTLATYLKEHIDHMCDYFLPIEEILFENDEIFIYRQKFCQPFDKKSCNYEKLIRIFEMVYLMLKRDKVINNISSHNLGLINNDLIIYDYHGMKPMNWNSGNLKNQKWWGRILRHLTEYTAQVFTLNKRKKYEKMMDKCFDQPYEIIKQLKIENDLPIPFMNLLDYCLNTSSYLDLNVVLKLIKNCIIHIKNIYSVNN